MIWSVNEVMNLDILKMRWTEDAILLCGEKMSLNEFYKLQKCEDKYVDSVWIMLITLIYKPFVGPASLNRK